MYPTHPQTICIDPGHPSENEGTRGKQITEIQLVWEIAVALQSALLADGYRIVLTKKRASERVLNKRRAEIANASSASLMLRLHCDSPKGATGYALYYPDRRGTAADGTTGPEDSVLIASRAVALRFHPAFREAMRGELKDNGLKTDRATAVGARQGGALTGSIYAQVPVLLAELCVLTNPSDERYVLSNPGRKRLVSALRAGVLAGVGPATLPTPI